MCIAIAPMSLAYFTYYLPQMQSIESRVPPDSPIEIGLEELAMILDAAKANTDKNIAHGHWVKTTGQIISDDRKALGSIDIVSNIDDVRRVKPTVVVAPMPWIADYESLEKKEVTVIGRIGNGIGSRAGKWSLERGIITFPSKR